jgi:CCR4-NOT transcriptional complex subunit CAF120
MSSFSHRDTKSPPPASPTTTQVQSFPEKQEEDAYRPSTPQHAHHQPSNIRESPQVRERVEGNRVSSRPLSMVQTYQPPLMELTQDTLPELQPIFTYLNSHGNKLYQEGYFLKLDDQNSRMSWPSR